MPHLYVAEYRLNRLRTTELNSRALLKYCYLQFHLPCLPFTDVLHCVTTLINSSYVSIVCKKGYTPVIAIKPKIPYILTYKSMNFGPNLAIIFSIQLMRRSNFRAEQYIEEFKILALQN